MFLKRTLILLVCAVLLLWFYFVPQTNRQNQKPPDPVYSSRSSRPNALDEKDIFPHVDLMQAVTISVTKPRSKQRFSFQKGNRGWEAVFPVHFPASEDLIQEWFQLLKIKRLRPFPPEDQNDLGSYGLSKPSLSVCIQPKEKTPESCLMIGNRAPAGKFYFAKLESERILFLLDYDFVKAFQNPAQYEFLRTRLFPYAFRDSKKILIHEEGKAGLLFEKKGSHWYYEKNQIPYDQMEKLLMFVNELHLREFMKNRKLEEHIFSKESPPKISIEVGWNGSSDILFLGASEPRGFDYYAKLSDWPRIFLVSKSKIEDILLLSAQLAVPVPK